MGPPTTVFVPVSVIDILSEAWLGLATYARRRSGEIASPNAFSPIGMVTITWAGLPAVAVTDGELLLGDLPGWEHPPAVPITSATTPAHTYSFSPCRPVGLMTHQLNTLRSVGVTASPGLGDLGG
jgi:hypothetical protein